MTPRVRFLLSVALFAAYGYALHRSHARTKYPVVIMFLGLSAISYLCLYITEHASNDSEERVGVFTSYVFLFFCRVCGHRVYVRLATRSSTRDVTCMVRPVMRAGCDLCRISWMRRTSVGYQGPDVWQGDHAAVSRKNSITPREGSRGRQCVPVPVTESSQD